MYFVTTLNKDFHHIKCRMLNDFALLAKKHTTAEGQLKEISLHSEYDIDDERYFHRSRSVTPAFFGRTLRLNETG